MTQSSKPEIPIIDFAAFRTGDRQARAAVARAIGLACEHTGFFYLRSHGIADALMTRAFDASRAFFALPQTVLNDAALVASLANPRGYVPFNSRKFAGATHPDLRDGFHMETERADSDPCYQAWPGLLYPNRWPVVMPEFRLAMLDYYAALTGLAYDLLHAFALALDLPENYLDTFFGTPLSSLALRHYPSQAVMTATDIFGIFPHKDEVAFTILAQDDVGGLQIRVGDDDWLDATPVPGAFVINIGDTMARWTNDRFASTWHRVVNLSGRERYSIPFFFRPNVDAVITCLPSCQGPDNPPRYEPIHVGQHAIGRLQRDWTKKDLQSRV